LTFSIGAFAATEQATSSGPSNALSGSYDIGGGGADFVDLAAAISKILTVGMDAPVQFNLKPGTYSTHVTITDITRHGQYDDWLTIQSEDPNDPAILEHDASSTSYNWLIRFDYTKFIKLENLVMQATGMADFSTVVSLENNSSYIEIINNEINGYTISNTAPDEDGYLLLNQTNSYLNNILIHNNTFNGGNGAVKFSGDLSGYISGVSITDNQFYDQEGTGNDFVVEIDKVRNVLVYKNLINNSTQNAGGMRLFRVDEGVISANRISMLGGGTGSVGLSLSNTNRGLDETVVVKNNFILAAHSPLYIQGNNTRNVSVFNNSVMADGPWVVPNTFPAALFVDESTENIIIQNNVLTNLQADDSAYAMIIKNSSTVTFSDNNVFHHESLNQFLVDGVEYANLTDYQMSTGMDTGSSDERIQFVNETAGDLHLAPAQYTNPTLFTSSISEVTYDIDGELRATPITLIGADDLNADVIFNNGFDLF